MEDEEGKEKEKKEKEEKEEEEEEEEEEGKEEGKEEEKEEEEVHTTQLTCARGMSPQGRSNVVPRQVSEDQGSNQE